MSEIGDDFAFLKEQSMKKRKANRENSQDILEERNIKFISKNEGAHLIVTGKEGLIDFWPGTGLFITRKGSKQGRGVFNLIKLCEVRYE